MANLNIRIDDNLKKQAEALFSDLGMSMSTAMTVFLKQAVRTGGIPFELKADPFYSAENQEHLIRAAKKAEAGTGHSVTKTIEELERMANE